MDAKEILKDLVAFNTVNDKENASIIDYIESYLRKLGFRTEYKTKCLVMSIGDDAKIGFLGHTDTVDAHDDWTMDPFLLKEDGNKLYGLGSSDMKGSIAAILASISKFDWSSIKSGVKLFFTFDEELYFGGINELVEKNTVFPEFMIIGEPTENEIINASKGLLELSLTFKGVSSHSSKPEEGINAIEKCIVFLNDLKEIYNELKKDTMHDKSTTMNIGVINGGSSINVVPNSCEVLIDFRTILQSHNDIIIDKVEDLIKDKNISLKIINNISPFSSRDDKINMSDFISEASFINSQSRYILGVGPNNAHKADEFINVDSLYLLEKQYTDLLLEYTTKK